MKDQINTVDGNDIPGKNKHRKKRKKSVGRTILKCIGRFFIWFFSTLAVLLAGLYIMLMYINKGPSPYIRNLFVASVMESSAGGILSQIFLSDEEIQKIMESNQTISFNEITDTTLINVVHNNSSDEEITQESDSLINDPDGDGIEVYEVHGNTYQGKMMIVLDPSRVKVAVTDYFSLDGGGTTLQNLITKYDCVAGINGGRYEDEMGLGIGGMPKGIVISDGQLLMGELDEVYGVYGFTYDDVLVVGNMTAQQALNMGVRDAVTFGPALITNGKSAGYSGYGSGLNPRTAIGQREDGAVLMLVIEGRQANSVGASYSDLIEIMLEYGAVNAANLDGGMSSSMILYDEEIVTNCQVRTARRIPTAFVVERLPEDE